MKDKRMKINWESIGSFAIVIFFVMAFLFLYYSVSFYYIGFHNVDLSVNMMRVLGDDIDNYVDQYNSNGDTISYPDAYIVGNEQMEMGFKLGIGAGILFGYLFAVIGWKLK